MATAKKKNNGIKIVLILVVFIVIFVLLNKKAAGQSPQNFSILPATNGSSSSSSGSSLPSNDSTVLTKGMKSDSVRKLQYLINKYHSVSGRAPIAVDGIFGNGTLTALRNITGKSALSYNETRNIISQQLRSRGLDPSKYI